MPQRKFKEEYEMENPWGYMADLPLEHMPTMRRIMLLIHHFLKPDEALFPKSEFNWTFLTRKERKQAMTMVDETKNNDLLAEMLGWFSAKFTEEDEEVADATHTLKTLVTYPVRHPKSYQFEYLMARKKWDMFLLQENEDIKMGGMDGGDGLSTTPNLRPSEFITSVSERKDLQLDSTQLSMLARNSFNGTKTPVQPSFQTSYIFKSPNWRDEICFKNSASAEVNFSNGSGESFNTKSRKRKKETIKIPYDFKTGDEDVTTESDPDEVDEEINVFQTEVLVGRKTRRGTEFSSFTAPPTSKKQKTSPGKYNGSSKRTKAPKTMAAPKTPPSKRRVAQKSIFADEDDEDDEVGDWESEISHKQKPSPHNLKSTFNGGKSRKPKAAPETPRSKRRAAQNPSYVEEDSDDFDNLEYETSKKQKISPTESRTLKTEAAPRTPPPKGRGAQGSSFVDDEDGVDDWEPDTVWT